MGTTSIAHNGADHTAMMHAHAALDSLQQQPQQQPWRRSKQERRSSPRLLASLEPIASSVSSITRQQQQQHVDSNNRRSRTLPASSRQQQQQQSPLPRATRTTGRLHALLETQTKRIYCTDSSNDCITAPRTRMPRTGAGQSRALRQPQSPLASAGARSLQSSLEQIQHAQQLHEHDAVRLARKLEVRLPMIWTLECRQVSLCELFPWTITHLSECRSYCCRRLVSTL